MKIQPHSCCFPRIPISPPAAVRARTVKQHHFTLKTLLSARVGSRFFEKIIWYNKLSYRSSYCELCPLLNLFYLS